MHISLVPMYIIFHRDFRKVPYQLHGFKTSLEATIIINYLLFYIIAY